jgi:hypothetical protein
LVNRVGSRSVPAKVFTYIYEGSEKEEREIDLEGKRPIPIVGDLLVRADGVWQVAEVTLSQDSFVQRYCIKLEPREPRAVWVKTVESE